MAVARVLLLVAALPALIQSSPLEEEVAAALARSGLKGAGLGVLIYSTNADAPLCSWEAKKTRVLASNAKLFTTACALAKLGPDYRFRTTLAWEEEGKDLHVFGAGDPLIGGRLYPDDPTRLFRDAAAKLQALGIRRFTGNLVLHAGIFDRESRPPGWKKQDPLKWYCAPIGGLTFNDSCVELHLKPGDAGEPPEVRTVPETNYVTLVNRITTVRGRPAPYWFGRKEGTEEIVLRGEMKAGSGERPEWVAVDDPVRYFGFVLKETLEREGIAVDGSLVESNALSLSRPSTEFILAEHTLGEAVQACNTVSQNLYAEMILKLLGFRFRGEGSTKAGLSVVHEFLEREVGVNDVELSDGSGLSRDNRASAESVVRLLRYMKKHRWGTTFIESLAVAGTEPGTLRRRLASAAGKLRAKTGHLAGVSALSGYAETAGGDTLVFSILANGWKAGSPDDFQNRVGELMVRWK
ncbi:MAG: D-alanyl-D-alanine carboxypeptidase/D-alanyl-D-alanine-endopeptidase [Planctomycetes bacterium]|nr:D-alanyl-D-alanine carboxypeptidase/D-alanyl-D-alanine-endopeptidase [Planctomycetota bacterium]